MAGKIERSNFLGSSLPREIRICIKHLNKCDEDVAVDLLDVVRQHMLQSDDNIMEEKFQSCFEKHGESVYQIYPGVLKILQLAIRQPTYILSQKDFVRDLKEVNFPEKHRKHLENLAYGDDRVAIDNACRNNRVRYATLNSFRWRVDVAISSGALKRLLEPSIVMELETSDGKAQLFEVGVILYQQVSLLHTCLPFKLQVSKQEFHDLRYSVANVLKQMQRMEKRSVLQIKS